MNAKAMVLLVLVVGVFLIGCTSTSDSASAYNQYNPQQGQQNQYVGGGCGVAAETDYGVPSAGQASGF